MPSSLDGDPNAKDSKEEKTYGNVAKDHEEENVRIISHSKVGENGRDGEKEEAICE